MPAQASSRPDGAADAAPSSRLSESSSHAMRRDAGAERGMDRELLLTPFGADQEEIRDVRAGDEQHDADRAEQHPEHPADVADHVLRERPHVRPDLRFLEHLLGEAGRHRKAIA